MRKSLLFITFVICSASYAQNNLKQGNTWGSEICVDAPYHMQKFDSLGILNPMPLHIYVHEASCFGCNNELMNVVVKIKNATDSVFQDTILYGDYTEEEFCSLFVHKSHNDEYLDIQPFDESLPLRSSEYTIDFTSHSDSFFGTTFVDITHDFWWFTMMIPGEKLECYDNVFDLEVYCELDWDSDFIKYLRVLRQEDEYPSVNNWLRGDVHYHGMFTQNDAELGLPLDATKLMGKYCGLNWIAITDHSCDFDNYGSGDEIANWDLLRSYISDLNVEDTSFLFIHGVELTVKNSADNQVHVLVYPSNENPLELPYFGDGYGDATETIVTVDMMVDSLLAYDAFAYPAHPFAQGDILSSVIDGDVWNLGQSDFPVNGVSHSYFGSVICNDTTMSSDLLSSESDEFIKSNIVGAQILNWADILKSDGVPEDPWDVFHTNGHGFYEYPESEDKQYMNRFMQNLEVVEFVWRKGLEAKNADDMIENWKLFISAGSDAHGSFNYSTTEYVLGIYGFVSNNAIGRFSSLAYCPDGMGNNAGNVLKALKNGNIIISSGPIVSLDIDTNGENDYPEIIIGTDTCIEFCSLENAKINVYSATSDEYGEVVDKKLFVKTATEDFEMSLPLNTNDWQNNLIHMLIEMCGNESGFLDQWILIRGTMKTHKTYSNSEIFACEEMDFWSFTNTMWLKISLPNKREIVNQDKLFSFYPNPANNSLTISTTVLGKISITNLVGQTLLEAEIAGTGVFDISEFAQGSYFIMLETKVGKITKKMLIVR
ncbi:MAG: hypothetical protein C0596_06195 [Marinilabiliales bacterium]|nr:MAG: hypothetical protein C0596_06195 [Marinilabiliales bacterium]